MYLIANRTQRLSGVAGAAIGLVDRDDLEYKAATGIAASLLGFKIRADTSVSFAVMKSQRTAEWGTEDAILARCTAARSIFSAPIYLNREIAGCIQLFSRVREFSQEATPICELMSAVVSQLSANNEASKTAGKSKRVILEPAKNLKSKIEETRQSQKPASWKTDKPKDDKHELTTLAKKFALTLERRDRALEDTTRVGLGKRVWTVSNTAGIEGKGVLLEASEDLKPKPGEARESHTPASLGGGDEFHHDKDQLRAQPEKLAPTLVETSHESPKNSARVDPRVEIVGGIEHEPFLDGAEYPIGGLPGIDELLLRLRAEIQEEKLDLRETLRAEEESHSPPTLAHPQQNEQPTDAARIDRAHNGITISRKVLSCVKETEPLHDGREYPIGELPSIDELLLRLRAEAQDENQGPRETQRAEEESHSSPTVTRLQQNDQSSDAAETDRDQNWMTIGRKVLRRAAPLVYPLFVFTFGIVTNFEPGAHGQRFQIATLILIILSTLELRRRLF
jgi:hypothetical protein